MSGILVSDIMTRDPISVSPNTDLHECAKKMVRKRVGSLLLTENKKLVGIISEKDILWAMIKKSKEDLSKIAAKDISPKKIATIKPNATIKEATSKMKKFKFRKLPVIYEGKLVGLITKKDILNFQPVFYPELEELAQVREESNKLKLIKKAKERKSIHEGICEECGNQELLQKVHGLLICESCKNSM